MAAQVMFNYRISVINFLPAVTLKWPDFALE
jgi:hypothetical protein